MKYKYILMKSKILLKKIIFNYYKEYLKIIVNK